MKRTVNRELIAVVAIMGLGFLAMAIPSPILPLYLTSIGITPTILGLILSVTMVGMIIDEPSLGWLAVSFLQCLEQTNADSVIQSP